MIVIRKRRVQFYILRIDRPHGAQPLFRPPATKISFFNEPLYCSIQELLNPKLQVYRFWSVLKNSLDLFTENIQLTSPDQTDCRYSQRYFYFFFNFANFNLIRPCYWEASHGAGFNISLVKNLNFDHHIKRLPSWTIVFVRILKPRLPHLSSLQCKLHACKLHAQLY